MKIGLIDVDSRNYPFSLAKATGIWIMLCSIWIMIVSIRKGGKT